MRTRAWTTTNPHHHLDRPFDPTGPEAGGVGVGAVAEEGSEEHVGLPRARLLQHRRALRGLSPRPAVHGGTICDFTVLFREACTSSGWSFGPGARGGIGIADDVAVHGAHVWCAAGEPVRRWHPPGGGAGAPPRFQDVVMGGLLSDTACGHCWPSPLGPCGLALLWVCKAASFLTHQGVVLYLHFSCPGEGLIPNVVDEGGRNGRHEGKARMQGRSNDEGQERTTAGSGRCGFGSGNTLCGNVYCPARLPRAEGGSRRCGTTLSARLCDNVDFSMSVVRARNGGAAERSCWRCLVAVTVKVSANASHSKGGRRRNGVGGMQDEMGGGWRSTCTDPGDGGMHGVWKGRAGSQGRERSSAQQFNDHGEQHHALTARSHATCTHTDNFSRLPPPLTLGATLNWSSWDGDGGPTKPLHQPSSSTWGPRLRCRRLPGEEEAHGGTIPHEPTIDQGELRVDTYTLDDDCSGGVGGTAVGKYGNTSASDVSEDEVSRSGQGRSAGATGGIDLRLCFLASGGGLAVPAQPRGADSATAAILLVGYITIILIPLFAFHHEPPTVTGKHWVHGDVGNLATKLLLFVGTVGMSVWRAIPGRRHAREGGLDAELRAERNRPPARRARWAVAPPVVGRARLRRRWTAAGVHKAIRLLPKTSDAAAVVSGGIRSRRGARRKRRLESRGGRPACCTADDGAEGTMCSLDLACTSTPAGSDHDRAEDLPRPAADNQFGSLRVGEASNPGPCPATSGTATVGGPAHPDRRLSWESDKTASALRYARPGSPGFYGARTAGFLAEGDGPPKEPFTLRMITANTTGWGPLQRLLLTTEAAVIFAQEHRLFEEALPGASAWARKRGWKSIWSPATPGPNGGASAGTVVLVRNFVGLRHPDRSSAEVVKGRVTAAVIEPPACRPFMGYSAYFHDGQGLSRANLELTAAVGEHWQTQDDPSLPVVVAADFNMEPAMFAQAGLCDKLKGRLVAPTSLRGTCRSRAKSSTYDYFFMTTGMADAVAEVRVVEGTGVKTHTPTEAVFHPRLTSLKALSLRMPPNILREEVFGPRPPPPPWHDINVAMDELVHFIKKGGEYHQADKLLEELYGLWVDTAECELVGITGTALPKMGTRSGPPCLVWRSILPEVSRSPPPSGAAALAWLADITRDALRLAAPPAHGEDVRGHELVGILHEALDESITGREALQDDGSIDRVRELLVVAAALVDEGRDCTDTQWIGWCHGAEAVLADLRSRQCKAAAAESADRLRSWKEWLRAGFDRGAKNAHAFMKLPAEWRPSHATLPSGLPSAEPTAILNGQRDKYGKAWAADDDEGRYTWPDRQSLPRLTPAELREASKSFKRATAIAYDGIHCRHYELLSDGALSALGALLEACELLGALPRQTRMVVTPLLDKPKGGFRPIAIYVSLYRLWAKARRGVAMEWEAAHQRSYFSAARGNGPQDTTWRQGVRQEARVTKGGAAASLFWDLESFFECIDRRRLIDRAEATGFPAAVLRLSLAMYAAPRILSLGGRIARELWPKRGVGAGCGLANTYVKVFSLLPMDALVKKLPASVKLDLHVDDFSIESTADTVEEAARDLIIAYRLVKEMIEVELGAVVSVPKAALVASSKRLAEIIRNEVGILAGPVRRAAANLGVDATAARRRGAPAAGPLRRARWANALKRRRKLRALADVVGEAAGKVFTVGIGASATYHAAVQGLTDLETNRIRRLAAVVFPPRSRFRSLTLTHVVHDMPTSAAESAATLQYARAVWEATLLGNGRPRHEGFDLPGLRGAWEAVAARSHEFLDPGNPDPNRRRKWSRSRGPLSSAMLELHRSGWTAPSPFEWIDDQGVVVQLTATPPALLRDMLKASARRQAERLLGTKWAKKDHRFEGKRLCVDAAMDALARSRTLTAKQKGAFRSRLLGGTLTRGEAARAGYLIDDVCELCGEVGDHVFHRTYECKGTRDVVRAALPKWFWEEAQRADPSDLFWTTAAMPHPADMVPMPRADYQAWAFDAEGERSDSAQMSGHAFIDGSCSKSVFRGLQRASIALVQLDDDARPVKTLSTPVWNTLPQTSQAAEYAAYAALPQVIVADTVAYGDCKGVLDLAARGPVERYSGKRRYAGVLLSMCRHPEGMKRITRTVKVKAHRRIDAISDHLEKWMAIGNDLADKAAKAARDRHPQPSHEVATQIAFWERRAPLIVHAVAIAMAEFSPLGGKLTRRANSRRTKGAGEPPTVVPRHEWEFVAGRWRCAQCWSYIIGDGGVPDSRRHERCQRERLTDRHKKFQSMGHNMLRTEGDLPISFCSKCGGWTSRRANRLARACGPPTPAGTSALRRIEAGLHPWQARDFKGKCLPRTRLAIKRRDDKCERAGHRTRTPAPAKRTVETPMQYEDDGGDETWSPRKRRRGPTDQAASMEGLDEHPPEYHDNVALDDEYDVFGHGGCLDQEVARGREAPGGDGAADEDATRTMPGDLCRMDDASTDVMMMDDLQGTSMTMLLAALHNAPKKLSQDHIVPLFNASSGKMVKARLRLVEDQVHRLRARGVRDTDQIHADGSVQATTRSPAVRAEVAPGSASADMERQREGSGVTFGSRKELLCHLRKAPAPASDVPGPPARGLKRRSEAEAEKEVDEAVASSIGINAVGTREGPGDPLRDAGATAAAVAHQSGLTAAAVTADRMVAALALGDLPHRIPPTVAPPRWTAEGTPEGNRPDSTTPWRWPKRPVAGTGGPSLNSLRKRPKRPVTGAGTRHARGDGDGECQPGVERRRDGADEPPSWSLVARCGADATGPGVEKEPLEGSIAQGVPGARNECNDLRRRPGDDMVERTVGDAATSAAVRGGAAGPTRTPVEFHDVGRTQLAEESGEHVLRRRVDLPRELRGSHGLDHPHTRLFPPPVALPPPPPPPGDGRPGHRAVPLCRRCHPQDGDTVGTAGTCLRDHSEGERDAAGGSRAEPPRGRHDSSEDAAAATSVDETTPRLPVCVQLRMGAPQGGARRGAAAGAAVSFGADDRRHGGPRDIGATARTCGTLEGCEARDVAEGPRPITILRRRITGKRKQEQVGDDGWRSPELEGPTSEVRRGAGGLQVAPAGDCGGAAFGDLHHDVEGTIVCQVNESDGNARYSSARRRRSNAVHCAGDIKFSADEPSGDDAAKGEMNTVNKYTSFSTAASSSSGSSHCRAGGDGAANPSLTGGGRSGAGSG